MTTLKIKLKEDDPTSEYQFQYMSDDIWDKETKKVVTLFYFKSDDVKLLSLIPYPFLMFGKRIDQIFTMQYTNPNEEPTVVDIMKKIAFELEYIANGPPYTLEM